MLAIVACIYSEVHKWTLASLGINEWGALVWLLYILFEPGSEH